MIAVWNWFPYGCMAPNGCDDPLCELCLNAAPIAGASDVRKGEGANRDGDPKLAGEKKRGNLAFHKSSRKGPSYVPSSARV